MATTSNKALDFDSMNDDDLLKQEQAMQEMLAKISDAKKNREANMKANAFKEIGIVLEKYVGSVISESVLTDWLDDNKYLITSKFEKIVEVKVSSGATVGRRKIDDKDLIFSMPYKNEDGTRDMTYKLDTMSKEPAPKSGTSVVMANLKMKTYEEIKGFFKPKFQEIKDTESGKAWVKKFFPAQYDAIYTVATESKEFLNGKPVEVATV